MPDLLIELLSEEIPARMQAKAADDLKGLVTNGPGGSRPHLAKSAGAFATPRCLALTVHGVFNTRSLDIREEKGPRTDSGWRHPGGFFAGKLARTTWAATAGGESRRSCRWWLRVTRPRR